MIRQQDRPELYEREGELAEIEQLLDATAQGSGGATLIEGAPGIGKTSLLAEGRARAAEAGLTVLAARGTEIERTFSFGVARQLFEGPVVTAESSERRRLLAGAAMHAVPLFQPGELIDQAASEDSAFATLHALYWLALNFSEAGPVLIAIDDLQWADRSSLRWVAYLVGRLAGTSVGLLATIRPIEDEDASVAAALADPASTVLHPSTLSGDAVAHLVREGLSSSATDDFCRACAKATGGNPLLLSELLRTLAAEGVEPSSCQIDAVERAAPDAVARSVRQRLATLPEDAVALADAVAVLGDGADGSWAVNLAGLEKRDLAPNAALLARAELLRAEPPLRFVHPLVRNAVYETSSQYEREQDHLRAAEVLTELAAPRERLVAQTILAPAGSLPGAASMLRAAAGQAAAEGAPESAASYLQRALEEQLDEAARAEVLLELAEAELALGAEGVVEHLAEAAAALAPGERRSIAQYKLGRALYWVGRDEEAVATLERALAEWDSDDEDLRRRLEGEMITNATRVGSQYERARERLAHIRTEPQDGPGARILLGIKAYHQAAAIGGDRRMAEDLIDAITAAMSEEERTWNFTVSSYVRLFCDKLDQGIRFLDPTIASARSSGAVFNFASLSMTRAIFNYAKGSLVEAEADARAALAGLPHRRAWFVPHAHAWLAQILVERDQLDEAAELIERAQSAVGSEPFTYTPVRRAEAMLAAARGDRDQALAQALALGQALAGYGHDNPAASYPAWRSLAAAAHHALGEQEAGLALAREELELARAWGAPRTLGRSLRSLGLVEGGAAGLALLRESVAVLEESPARLEYAYSLTDLGAALRRGNKRAAARESLTPALDLAQRCGAVALASRAREELVASGARPRRAVLSGVASLTPSERRTAQMAAEGMSNKQIAQALFVTLRTVEMHLSNTFRKLDISSRTQLTDVAGLDAASVDAA